MIFRIEIIEKNRDNNFAAIKFLVFLHLKVLSGEIYNQVYDLTGIQQFS